MLLKKQVDLRDKAEQLTPVRNYIVYALVCLRILHSGAYPLRTPHEMLLNISQHICNYPKVSPTTLGAISGHCKVLTCLYLSILVYILFLYHSYNPENHSTLARMNPYLQDPPLQHTPNHHRFRLYTE